MKNSFLFIAAFALCLTACHQPKSNAVEHQTEQHTLDTLIHWMSGSFNSAAQAAVDSNYYSIDLHMKPFLEKEDAHYLYVEQALSSMPEAPYRQRVYRVSAINDSSFKSEIFLLPADSLFIGAQYNDSLLKNIDLSSLSLKEGCDVFLTWDGQTFSGATKQGACLSDFRGAAYATSEVSIHRNAVWSWDRGWDSTDTYVWGAEFGAYQFDKQNPFN